MGVRDFCLVIDPSLQAYNLVRITSVIALINKTMHILYPLQLLKAVNNKHRV